MPTLPPPFIPTTSISMSLKHPILWYGCNSACAMATVLMLSQESLMSPVERHIDAPGRFDPPVGFFHAPQLQALNKISRPQLARAAPHFPVVYAALGVAGLSAKSYLRKSTPQEANVLRLQTHSRSLRHFPGTSCAPKKNTCQISSLSRGSGPPVLSCRLEIFWSRPSACRPARSHSRPGVVDHHIFIPRVPKPRGYHRIRGFQNQVLINIRPNVFQEFQPIGGLILPHSSPPLFLAANRIRLSLRFAPYR